MVEKKNRVVLALITFQSSKIHSMDTQSVFLQGKPIERVVFFKPPKEASTNKVWKMNATVYGLCDTPSAWYLSLNEESINMGGVKSRYDGAVFFWHNNQLLQGILSSHVDNFFWSGTEWFQKNIIDHSRKKYTINKKETQALRYLSLTIAQKKTVNCIDQNEYIKKIECIKLDTPGQKEHKVLPQETQQLHRVAGQLNWISTQTRSDMAYAASAVSSSIKDDTVRDIITPNKFIKTLKSKDACHFQKLMTHRRKP